jgi:sterol desaturase/sphingolipid hydroxylase (fatty acid hydroxylase superfamily)
MEVYQYYVHRLLHWRPVYKRVHYMHHEWTYPVAATTLYLHPLEYAILTVPSVVVGMCERVVTVCFYNVTPRYKT